MNPILQALTNKLKPEPAAEPTAVQAPDTASAPSFSQPKFSLHDLIFGKSQQGLIDAWNVDIGSPSADAGSTPSEKALLSLRPPTFKTLADIIFGQSGYQTPAVTHGSLQSSNHYQPEQLQNTTNLLRTVLPAAALSIGINRITTTKMG